MGSIGNLNTTSRNAVLSWARKQGVYTLVNKVLPNNQFLNDDEIKRAFAEAGVAKYLENFFKENTNQTKENLSNRGIPVDKTNVISALRQVDNLSLPQAIARYNQMTEEEKRKYIDKAFSYGAQFYSH